MKRLSIILIALLVCIPMLAFSGEKAEADQVDWNAFGKNLVKAIASGNEGLQRSAMRLIIHHADKVDVGQAVFDLVQIYRNNKNEKVRQLAIVTIYKIQNKWAMGFLKRDLKFEESPVLQKQILACLNDY
jgi:hypothetical protein